MIIVKYQGKELACIPNEPQLDSTLIIAGDKYTVTDIRYYYSLVNLELKLSKTEVMTAI